ncbi:unnamed protein product [Polarella glacialis]|uniref:Uncharacterized protein n=1 Tax=Polarella glacialis TaxID=89957 RepID=A0A813FWH7_POLGL|nr:unnamed protein product [Polarella glacialis]
MMIPDTATASSAGVGLIAVSSFLRVRLPSIDLLMWHQSAKLPQINIYVREVRAFPATTTAPMALQPEEEDEYEDYDNQDEVQVLVARARRLQGTNASPLERASEEMTGLDEAELEQRLTRKKNMKASFGFKSSPGALGGSGSKGFKKERMGTTMQSQDCDNMTKMLQTKLRPDVPCMVCDINTGQVLIANFHADDLFESSAATGRLVPPDRRDKLWKRPTPECQAGG